MAEAHPWVASAHHPEAAQLLEDHPLPEAEPLWAAHPLVAVKQAAVRLLEARPLVAAELPLADHPLPEEAVTQAASAQRREAGLWAGQLLALRRLGCCWFLP